MNATRLDGGNPSPPHLQVLILEDNPRDAKLMVATLEGGGYTVQFEVTDSPEVFRESLEKTEYDVILADFNLRNWTAIDALEILKRSGKDVPLIVVTGSIGDEAAVECIRQGAADYVLKDRPASLPLEVRRALKEKRLREERRRTEKALRESEERYRDLVEFSNDWVWQVDENGVYTYVGPQCRELLGYEPEETIGKTPFDLMPPEEQQRVGQAFGAIAAQRAPFRGLENTNLHKDGHLVILESNGTPVVDERGIFRGYRGMDRDITERKRAEEALRESEELYRSVVTSVAEGIVLEDRAGAIVACNRSAGRILGLTTEELIGRTVLDQSRQAIHEDRSPFIGENLPSITALRTGKAQSNVCLGVHKPDGTLAWILANSEPIFHAGDGAPYAVVTSFADITERKRAEEALREANRALTAISAVNEAVLHTTEEPLLLQEVCRHIVKHAGYRMAWVGFLSDGEPKRIYPVAEAGSEQGYLRSIDVRWDDSGRGRGPTGTAAQTRRPAIVRNTAPATGFAPWRAEATARGYASVIGLPLLIGENLLGVLTIYSAQPGAFDKQEVHLLTELAGDLAFGIQVLRTRAEQARAEEALRASEQRYRLLFERNLAGVCRASLDGGFLDCNDAYARMLGYQTREEILAQPVVSVYFDPAEREAYWAKVRERGTLSNYELRLRRKDGSPVWVLCNDTLLEGEVDGQLVKEATVIDITERKRAEAALIEERHLLHTLMDNLPDVIYFKDRESRFTRINKAHAKEFGLSDPAQAVGKTDFDFFTDEHAQQAYADEQEIIRTGQPVVGKEEKETWPDGRETWVSTTKMPLRDAHGNIIGTFGVSRDITERKRAEGALQVTERQLAQAMETALLGHWEFNPATGIFTFNDRFYALYGTTAEREGGYQMSAEAYAREFLYPEDVHIVADEVAKALAITDPDAGWALEHRIRRRDGEMRHIVVRISVIKNSEGLTIKTRGVNQDITERKRAEEKLRQTSEALRTLVQASPLAIVALDLSLHVQTWNPAAERLFGWTESEVLGHALPIIPESRWEKFRATLGGLMKGETGAAYETQRQRKDGSLIDVSVSTGVLRDASGEATGVVGILTDLTERKSMEGQLRQTAKIEAIGRLAGGVAHDFNNLLTIISGYGQLLQERLSPTDLGPVEEILKASDRAASLTRQLLAFSRRQILAPQVLDLNSVVANMEKMLGRLIGEDIELATVQQPGLGRVKADPGQIEQVIMNLVVNSRDAMPEGGKITLETANVDLDETFARRHTGATPGPHVMLAVSDTGTGMDAETLTHIFEPFFTTKEKGKGTGLGLATVYGIVKQSAGSIWAYSEPGRGSTFKVYLPRVEKPAREAEPATARSELAKGSETVLVVEDEEGVRSLVCETLASHGYKVLEAGGADHALTICEQHAEPIHLLLTDVVMPHMGGKELAKHLSSVHPEAKVLYMSGYTDNAIVRHSVLEGGTPFLQKPFGPKTLAQKVREVLNS
jgi:two-component system, cell cycle sensor histidine kinase and response regulator CckA